MNSPVKPMKSADLARVDNDVTQLRYPALASPKLDGLRCLVLNGVALSNNLEPFRNRFLQDWARNFHDIDGELIVGEPTGGNVLGRTQSGIMSFDGEPDFTLHAFDAPMMSAHLPYEFRLRTIRKLRGPRISVLEHTTCYGHEELILYEQDCIGSGYEGVMIRDPQGAYKYGRSTLREGYLIKLKRFMDGEAIITGFEEAEHNANTATTDKLGRTKRSAAKSGKTGAGMVGTILVHDAQWGELRLAPGTMTHEDRRFVFANQAQFLGSVAHWRSFGYGIKDKPRFPRFYGFR